MKLHSKLQAIVATIPSAGCKLVFLLVFLTTTMAAFADVPPPKNPYADTTISGMVNNNGIVMPPVEMATGMRSNGKIYVVVAVLSLILLGLFFYVFTLDKKISKLEKEL